jgi:N-acetylglucosaminyl-diphospho-decaprenol L-rhamnosyltransferase
MRDTGVVVVTYNSEKFVGPCLDALRDLEVDVIVIDNHSKDQTVEQVLSRGVRCIANDQNRGFAAAVNQGIQAIDSSRILLLNPDAVLQSGLGALREACEMPHTAGASGKLLNVAGEPQTGFMVRRLPTPLDLIFEVLLINRAWPRNPVNWHYRCLGFDYDREQPVEQPPGAFLMIRRDVWLELGGMDESYYPLWFEDVDFCRRARDRGYRFQYVPVAVAKHTGGHSILKIPLEQREIYWYGSLLRFGARHFHGWSHAMVCLAVIIGSFLRMTVSVALRRSLSPIAVYGRVVRLAGRYLVSGRHGSEELLSAP